MIFVADGVSPYILFPQFCPKPIVIEVRCCCWIAYKFSNYFLYIFYRNRFNIFSIFKSFFAPMWRQEKNRGKERREMPVSEQEAVCHRMWVDGMIKICQLTYADTAGPVVRSTRADRWLAMETALGSSAGMVLLSQLKGRRLITLSMGPHRKDDPDPHIGKRPYGNGVAFALCSFTLIVVLSPRLALGTLPRKLMQGVAQRFDAAQPTMSFGIHATLIEDRRGPCQCLQTAGILVALTIIPNLRKPPWSQMLSRTRQTLEDGVILMGQKKGVDLFVIVGNLFHEWQQLAHQGQHQARFGASEDHIGLQLRLVQQFHHRSRSIG